MKVGKRKVITVSIPVDLLDIMGDISNSDGVPRSRMITMAMESFIRYKYPNMWRILEVNRNA